MALDNRTTLDACDSTAAWTGSTSPSADTAVKYQGSASMSVQSSNAYRNWYATISSTNLTSTTIYFMAIVNVPIAKASGGIRCVLGDGTHRRAYYVGGSDDLGIGLAGGWRSYRLDTANLPTSYSQDAGSTAPALTAITQVGIGTYSNAKAVASTANTWFDRFSYIANGSPALTVNAGTSGTPITFDALASDDITNGWGLVNAPIAGSKQYGIYGAVAWGSSSPSTATYFNDSDAQVYIIGTDLSANTMDQDFISNSGATNSFVLNNVVCVHVGEKANWNLDSTNFNIQQFDGCQFIDSGTMAFHTTSSSSNRYLQGCQFIGCEQIDLKGTYTRDTAFKSTSDTVAALLWNNNIDIEDSSFQNNTTGAGIEHPDWNGTENGTVTTADATGTTLIDSTATFSGNVSISDIVYNETDQSYGTVTSIDSNTQITHTALTGGTDNDWDSSDAYSIASPYTYTNLTFSSNTNDVDNTTSGPDVVAISKTGTSNPVTYPSGDFVVIQGAVTIQVTVVDTGNSPIENAQAAIYLSSNDTELMNELTNASGIASASYTSSTPANIYVRIRKSTTLSTRYFPVETTGTIGASGFSATITLRQDTITSA
jgi:hypothetical protein